MKSLICVMFSSNSSLGLFLLVVVDVSIMRFQDNIFLGATFGDPEGREKEINLESEKNVKQNNFKAMDILI